MPGHCSIIIYLNEFGGERKWIPPAAMRTRVRDHLLPCRSRRRFLRRRWKTRRIRATISRSEGPFCERPQISQEKVSGSWRVVRRHHGHRSGYRSCDTVGLRLFRLHRVLSAYSGRVADCSPSTHRAICRERPVCWLRAREL